MKLSEKLLKASKNNLQNLYNGLYNDDQDKQKEDYVSKIVEYYSDVNHFKYLLSDAEIAFLESRYEPKLKKTLFAKEINSLKERYFVHKNGPEYILFDELVPIYQKYCQLYNKEERENFGMYRYLTIAYIYAYGALRIEEIEGLFMDVFSDFNEKDWKQYLQESNNYQGKILIKKADGDTYYCINDDEFASAAIELKKDTIIDEYAVLDEDSLMAYYLSGYDSSNQALADLEKMLHLSPGEKNEFVDLIIYTYGLLQNKEELLDFILDKLRYDYFVSNATIIKAFDLVDEAFHKYGSYVTKGFSPDMFEEILRENFELMSSEDPEEEEIEEEPIN